MGEKVPLSKLLERYDATDTFLTHEEIQAHNALLARKRAREAAEAQAAAAERARLRAEAENPNVGYAPAAPVNTAPARPERQKGPFLTRKRVIGAIAAIAVLGTGAYGTNFVGFQTRTNAFVGSLFPHKTSTEAASTGAVSTSDELKGENALLPANAIGDDATKIVVGIRGYEDLVPLVNKDKYPGVAIPAAPYLTDKSSPFYTSDGYEHAELDVNLGVIISETSATSTAFKEDSKGNVELIDRSQIQVTFEDANGLTRNTNNPIFVYPGYQAKSSTDYGFDSTYDKVFSLPNTNEPNMRIQPTVAPNIDKAFNNSLVAITKDMQTPEQSAAILGTLETGGVKNLANDGTVLRDAVDTAILKLLKVNPDHAPDFEGNYIISMDVAKDPTTKTDYGVTQLKGIDPTQQFHTQKVTITQGKLDISKIKPLPTPKPTATANSAP